MYLAEQANSGHPLDAAPVLLELLDKLEIPYKQALARESVQLDLTRVLELLHALYAKAGQRKAQPSSPLATPVLQAHMS